MSDVNSRTYLIAILCIIGVVGTGITYAVFTNSPSTGAPQTVAQIYQPTLLGTQGQGTSSAGFSLVSLSLVDMYSSIPWMNQQDMWVLSVTAGTFLGQTGYMNIGSGDAQTTGAKELRESDFSIQVTNVDQTCEYKIVEDASLPPVYTLNTIAWSELGQCEMVNAPVGACPSPNKWMITSTGFAGSGTPVPITTTNLGAYSWCKQICGAMEAPAIGFLQNPIVHTIVDTGLYGGKDGATYTGRIDTTGLADQSFFKLGPENNPIGAVLIHGTLSTGQSCPTQDPYTPVYTGTGAASWKLVMDGYYATYQSSYDALKNQQICRWDALGMWCNDDTTWNTIVTKVNAFNSAAQEVLRDVAVFGTINDKTSEQNAVVIHDLQTQVANPLLTYYLKASWVGIYTPAPKAQIISTGSECFLTSDRDATISVTVKNIGDEQGNFEVAADCPSPFNANAPVTIGLRPQEQVTVKLPLSGGAVTAKTTAQCLIKVASTLETITASQQVCLDPRIVCQANNKWCEGTKIMECNAQGSVKTVVMDCAPESTCEKTELGVRCASTGTCDKDGVCESADGETVKNCADCSPFNMCDSCSEWLFAKFKDSADQCAVKKVFETECKWYDVGCGFHNMMVPDWDQDSFCPVVVGLVALIIGSTIILVLLVLKKKGLIGKGGRSSSSKGYTYKPLKSSGIVGWRGK